MAINKQILENQRQAILSAFSWTKEDFDFALPVRAGAKGVAAKRIQELLSINGHHVTIDSDYGSATNDAVAALQASKGLPSTGVVDADTRLALLEPLLRAAEPVAAPGATYDTAVQEIMQRHVGCHPVEAGGDNRGPWVRLYCQGKDGAEFRWCAGFVSFILLQAAAATKGVSPLKYTLSCDNLAGDAKEKKRFMAGKGQPPADTRAPAIFLLRRTDEDWTHTGLISAFGADSFSTIEGNSNEEGSSNGFEACARHRGYDKKDFIRIAGS